jgi:hypothetical protein
VGDVVLTALALLPLVHRLGVTVRPDHLPDVRT